MLISWIDGTIFERLNSLQDWIVPHWDRNKPVKRAQIKSHNGADLRLFFGASGSYFAYDISTREYRHNLESRDMRNWLSDHVDLMEKGKNDEPILKEGYAPHSFIVGPGDVFCTISAKDFCVNDAFRQTFPSIEPFLVYAKHKNILNQVVSLSASSSRFLLMLNKFLKTSPSRQVGSKQPSYVLYTSFGVCVSSVPASAVDIVSRYTTHWGASNSVERAKEAVRTC
jgi:hypothetical protein